MRFIYTKSFLIFFVALAVFAFVALADFLGYLGPVKRALMYTPRLISIAAVSSGEKVKVFFSSVFKIRKIILENYQLNEQLAQFKLQTVQLNLLKNENDNLRNELGFAKSSNFELIPCAVLSQNPVGLRDTVVVGCGIKNGIKEGQVVISKGFVAGRILYAADEYSTIQLAISPGFAMDVKVLPSGSAGVLRGSYGSGLFVDQISQDANIADGDFILTTGINPQVEKNLTVGQVGAKLSKDNDLFKRYSITTPLNFYDLDFMFSVLK